MLPVVTKQTPMLEELSGESMCAKTLWGNGNILTRMYCSSSKCLVEMDSQAPPTTDDDALAGCRISRRRRRFDTGSLPIFQRSNVLRMVGTPFVDERETKRIRTGLEADHQLATFLNDLRPRSLETFEIISYSNIGAESFLALNCHRESLTELKINNVKPEAMPALSMLKGCTSLTTLLLTETTGITDLEKTQHDVFLEIIAWLLECKSLENVTFRKFLSAPAIMTPLLLENDIHLSKLEIEGYVMKDSREFHQALAHQRTLQRVWLKGDGEEVMRDDLDTLVDALSTLHHLRDLRLRDVSDYFKDEHICQLARSLPELEEFFTSGYGITDAIWTDVASLKVLRRLDLNAMTRFTLDGILDFISNLGDGNRGLLLAVMMADADSNLTEEEQSLIQETMAAKVEGRFEFTLMRGNS